MGKVIKLQTKDDCMTIEDCNDYEIPDELRRGLELDRLILTDSGKFKKSGKIKLIRPKNTWREVPPTPFCECETLGTINIIKELWVVELKEDRMSKWVRTASWVRKFHSTGVIHIKDEIDEEE